MPKATDGERGGEAVSVDPRHSVKVGGEEEGALHAERPLLFQPKQRYMSNFLEECVVKVGAGSGGATIKGHADEKETMFTEPLRGATPGGEFSRMTTRGFEVC